MDATDADAVKKAFAAAVADLGTVNVLVYNTSAGFNNKTVMEIDPQDFVRSLEATCVGALLCSQVRSAVARSVVVRMCTSAPLCSPMSHGHVPRIAGGHPRNARQRGRRWHARLEEGNNHLLVCHGRVSRWPHNSAVCLRQVRSAGAVAIRRQGVRQAGHPRLPRTPGRYPGHPQDPGGNAGNVRGASPAQTFICVALLCCVRASLWRG